jgi:hypothetical protein
MILYYCTDSVCTPKRFNVIKNEKTISPTITKDRSVNDFELWNRK